MPGFSKELTPDARRRLFDRILLLTALSGLGMGSLAWLAARGAGIHLYAPAIAVAVATPVAMLVARRTYAALAAAEEREHERRREEATLRARMGELAFLFDPSTQATLALDTQTMLDLAAQRLVACCEAHQSSIMLHNPERGLLEVRAVSGVDASLVAGSVAAPGEGIAGTVYASGEPILLTPEVMAERFPDDIKAGRSIRSSASVPMRFRDTTIGVVSVSRSQGPPLEPMHMRALEGFAERCAAVILRAGGSTAKPRPRPAPTRRAA